MGIDAAAAGRTLFFCGSLIASTIVWLFGLTYLGHAYGVVSSSSAVGTDKVDWPDDPPTDRARAAVNIVYFLTLSLVPVGFLMKLALFALLPGEPWWRFAIGATIGVWLIFPLCVISSLTAASQWAPLHLSLVATLMRRPTAVVVFYLLSLAVVGIPAALICLTLTKLPVVIIPAAALGGAGLLIHARLVGRLTWLLNRAVPKEKSKPPAKRKRRARPGLETSDPWEPKEQTEAPAPRKAGDDDEEGTYGLASSVAPVDTTPKYKQPFERTEGTYDVKEVPPEELETEKAVREMALPTPEQVAMHIRQPREPGPKPKLALFVGVFEFPWYPTNVQNWIIFSGILLAMLAMVYLSISLYPLSS